MDSRIDYFWIRSVLLVFCLLFSHLPMIVSTTNYTLSCPYTVPCSTNATLVINSHVGNDTTDCVIVNETIHCNSLNSALYHIAHSPNSWLILIVSDLQTYDSIVVTFKSSSCIVLCGIDSNMRKPSVNIYGMYEPYLHLQSINKHNVSLAIINLAIDFGFSDTRPSKLWSTIISGFSEVLLSNLAVTRSCNWEIDGADNININHSTFHETFFNHDALLKLTVSTSITLTNLSITNIYGRGRGAPIYIQCGNINDMSGYCNVSVDSCIINGSRSMPAVDGDDNHMLNAAFFIVTSSPSGNVKITNSIIADTSGQFAHVVYMKLPIGVTVYFTNNKLHNNYLPIGNSLVYLLFDGFTFIGSSLRFSKTSFFHNNGTMIDINCGGCLTKFSNCQFYENYGQVLKTLGVDTSTTTLANLTVWSNDNEIFSDTALFDIKNGRVYFEGTVSIMNNIGTGIKMTNTDLTVIDNDAKVYLVNNTGRYGGGLFCDNVKTDLQESLNLYLIDNAALLGAAVYVKTYNGDFNCYSVLNSLTQLTAVMSFKNNKAITKGDKILIDFGSKPPADISNCTTINENVSTLFYNVLIRPLDSKPNIELFPGQLIKFEAYVSQICEATLYITCPKGVSWCPSLFGSIKVVLPEGNNTVTTDLTVKTHFNTTYSDDSQKVDLHVIIKSTVQSIVHIPLVIKNCSLGFTLDSENETCQPCNQSQCDKALYQSSLEYGAACVHKNYWYGTTDSNETIIHRCFFPFCGNSQPCPFKTNQPYTFTELPHSQDKQCLFNKGGVLCRQCAVDYKFTYLGVKCVNQHCDSKWNLVGLIALTVVINFTVGILWLVAMKFKGGLTFGTSLGPLLFIALGRKIPFGAYKAFQSIEVIFSFFSALILDNSILGYISVCTPITTGVGQHALNYIGPVVIVFIMIIIILASYCCPRCLHRMTGSYLQMICLLGLVTFWSLASTSINLILPIKLGDSYRFAIDPNVPINSYYTLVWLVSIPVLILVLTVVVFMIVSPYLSKCFNTLRIKPILDVIQSCYKDKWRWYSMVYFTIWMVITPLTAYNVPSVFVQSILLGILTVQFLFRPYSFKWLNTMDTLLLLDLLILFVTVSDTRNVEIIDTESKVLTTRITAIFYRISVYILALLPLLGYVVFALVVVIISKVPWFKKCFGKASQEFTVNEPDEEEGDGYMRDVYQSLRESQRHEIGRLRDKF